jgi:hypothetical protein
MSRQEIQAKILRRMKFSSDQQGILNRYLGEGDNWESHLDKTRAFIVECLEQSGAETVALLGSGWLLDVPLDYLARRFRKIWLVDIVHPRQIVQKVSKMEHAELVEADLTGGAVRGVYDYAQQYRKGAGGSILDIPFQSALPGIRPDYVVSLNILNQLDMLLIDYLSRFMDIPGDEKRLFRRRIQEQHLKLLEPGRSCLISDTEERVLDRKGTLVSSRPLVFATLPEGRENREWTWTFDTRGAYNRGMQTGFLVRALRF